MKETITKNDLFKRQTTLKEIGDLGQKRLQNAKIIIIGCGGLGCIAAVYLAASGIGNIHLVDYDTVSLSNLHRQVFYKTDDVGAYKSEVLSRHIEAISPFVTISFSKKAITKKTVFDVIKPYDIVLDCTDSLIIKYLLNDACVIKNKVLVYGSLYKFDGYVATFNALDDGNKRTANLRDAFPKIPENAVPNCSEVGTLNTIVGIIGLMQANEVLKIITKTGQLLSNKILIYNSLENSQFVMKLNRKITKKHIEQQFKNDDYLDINCDLQDDNLLITSDILKQTLNDKNLILISVIENINTTIPFKVNLKIPFSKLENAVLKLDKQKKYVIVCNRGILSYKATILLKEHYADCNILSLKNGITNY
jgi:adenylyltransferase/sulfurtransferase